MLKPFSVSKNIMGHIRLCVNGFCREFPITSESHYKTPEYRPCMLDSLQTHVKGPLDEI